MSENENTLPVLSPRRAVVRSGLHPTLFWSFSRATFIDYFKIFHRLRFRNQCWIPVEGPIIIAPNHVSYYDPPMVAAGVPHRMRFMTWDALFRIPVMKQMMTAYGAFPVKHGGAPDKAAISATLKVLKDRECIMIFPEGGRSVDGKLRPFEQGLARLALQTGAKIVPVAITGAYEAWSVHSVLPHWFRRITVKFYPPIIVEGGTNRAEMRDRIAELNEKIAAPIARRLRAHEKLMARRARR